MLLPLKQQLHKIMNVYCYILPISVKFWIILDVVEDSDFRYAGDFFTLLGALVVTDPLLRITFGIFQETS